MGDYILMHRDIACGVLNIDTDSGSIRSYHGIDNTHAPFLGNAEPGLIKKWWEARAIPASRKTMAEIILSNL